MQTCNHCKVEKEITEFRKSQYKKGYGSVCVPCLRAKAREYNKRTGFMNYKNYEKTPSGI